MSEHLFNVISHTIPASHIREFPRGARSPSAALKLRLAVKQYVPKSSRPLPNAVTFLTANAIGMPKETYEPLWDILLSRLPPGSIRAIWTVDATNHGASAVLNDGLLGDDPHWWDHSRDLLGLVNHFAAEMPQPIVGIAHSMGCAMILRLSLLHARLMCGLIMLEPVVEPDPPPGPPNKALRHSTRQDWWPDRATAEEDLRSGIILRTCDPAVVKCYLAHALRDVPTPVYPDPAKGGVTLKTSKAQGAWSFFRGNFAPVDLDNRNLETVERIRSPEASSDQRMRLFHRAEMSLMDRDLPLIRPRVLWVYVEKSYVNSREGRQDKLRRTGTGLGGNGGVATGGTSQIIIPNASHLLPMESPEVTIDAILPWLRQTLNLYDREEKWHLRNDPDVSEQNMSVLSKTWMKNVQHPERTPREIKGTIGGSAEVFESSFPAKL